MAFPGFFDNRGWGFGVPIVDEARRRSGPRPDATAGMVATARRGSLRTRKEDLVAILDDPVAWGFPLAATPVYLDFWTSAYQAIDD